MFMPSFCIKLIELGIATTCLILQQYSYDLTDVSTLILCSGTYVGFILVITGELIGEMVFAPLDVIQDVYFSVVGMAMFGTCGWILYTGRTDDARNPRTDDTLVLYSAGLAALNVLIMFCDTRVSTVASDTPCREMLSTKQDPFIEAWWSSAGAVLYGACGARTLQGWRHVPDCPRRDIARATAICALISTSVLIIDAIRVLYADDGSSIVSSHHKKITKAKAPKLGLNLMGASEKTPICMNISPARLIPAKVPMNEGSRSPSHGLNVDARLTGGAPKISPQKLTLKKFPAECRPLTLGPKVNNRSFW